MLKHSLVMLSAAGLTFFTSSFLPLIIVTLLSFLLLFLRKIMLGEPANTWFHAANILTTVRLLAIVGVLLFEKNMDNEAIGATLLLALLADGLDGWLARKNGNASAFGALFDAETDALFVLAAGFLIFEKGLLGGWVLAAGLLRYLYFLLVFIGKPAGWQGRRFLLAKIIAGILMATLAGCFFLPDAPRLAAAIGATVLVFCSFAFEFFAQSRA
ncbi:MAG: CDP-alcohol phosphatidyltransferase family protein [Bacteroidota bacterium]